MPDARRAGIELAAVAARTDSTIATPANVTASVGETPTSDALSHLPAATPRRRATSPAPATNSGARFIR